MSADRVRHGISRKGRFSLLYTHTQTYMCKQTYRDTHADIHMHLSMLQMMTPCAYILGASRKSKNCCILQMITFCLFLGVCVCVYLKGEYSSLYPYKSLPILFPLVLSPPISYQASSSNSLYLPNCRSLSVFTLLHLPSHLSFLCFFSPPSSSPHPLSPSLVISLVSVSPIVAVISQI